MERNTEEWDAIIEFLQETDEELHQEFLYFDRRDGDSGEDTEDRVQADNARDKGFTVRELLKRAEENRSTAFLRENWV